MKYRVRGGMYGYSYGTYKKLSKAFEKLEALAEQYPQYEWYIEQRPEWTTIFRKEAK